MTRSVDPQKILQDTHGSYTIVDGEKQRVIFVTESAQDRAFQRLQLRECAKTLVEKTEELFGRIEQLGWQPRTPATKYLRHRLPLMLNEFKQLDAELEQYRE